MSDDDVNGVVEAVRNRGHASAEVGTMLDALDENGLVKVIERVVGDLHGVRAGAQARLEVKLVVSQVGAVNRFSRTSTCLAIAMIIVAAAQVVVGLLSWLK